MVGGLEHVRVIVFSKDRAFQLRQYLRSLFVKGRGATLDVHVLYRVDPPVSGRPAGRDFAASYASVQAAFPAVSFVPEVDLAAQLKELVAGSDGYILFGVDDALFCGDLPLGDSVAALQAHSSLLCVHLRLSPGLIFCHTANAIQRLPRLRTLGRELAWFKGGDGSHDWDYPFDLCATLYRKNLVERVLCEIEATHGCDGLGHPNKLETNGNKVLASMFAVQEGAPLQQPLRACLQRRAVVVVTINCVQAVFKNRVFTRASDSQLEVNAADDHSGQQWDVEALDRLLYADKDLDEDAYLAQSHLFSSVHVGDLLLKPRTATDAAAIGPSSDRILFSPESACSSHSIPRRIRQETPLVSVVMPVHNSEQFLSAALQSLQRQTLGTRFEVIIVNDASTDKSRTLIEHVCEHDSRFRELRLSHNVGVAKAINVGVNMALAPIIARMDADDVCHPDRLRRQLLFLLHHPGVAAVGSAVSIVDSEYEWQHPASSSGIAPSRNVSSEVAVPTRDDSSVCYAQEARERRAETDGLESSNPAQAVGNLQEHGYKIIEHPTLAGHVRWRLLFHCCVAHPSVMIRKDALLSCGGYMSGLPEYAHPSSTATACSRVASEGQVQHIEDYHLWLRLVGLVPSPRAGKPDDSEARSTPSCCDAGRDDRQVKVHDVCNLGDVLLLLRKHPNNISAQKATEQASSSLRLRQLALAHVLLPKSPSGTATSTLLSCSAVHALGRPTEAESCQSLKSAQQLLQDLRERRDMLLSRLLPSPAAPLPTGQETAAVRDETGEEELKGVLLARRAVDLEIEGRATEVGTEALKRLETGDPLAMEVWRQWLTTSTPSTAPMRSGRAPPGVEHGAALMNSEAAHPLFALLKGFGRS